MPNAKIAVSVKKLRKARKNKQSKTTIVVSNKQKPRNARRQMPIGNPSRALTPKGMEYVHCAIRSHGGPVQIPDGSATSSLGCKFQYCHVIRPDTHGVIEFAITPNIIGNLAMHRGVVQDFPIYDLAAGAWTTTTYDSDVLFPTAPIPFVSATFPDLQAGNPLNEGQNQAFYRVQSWRCVDSCAKITYRGAPLYSSGTAQVVRQSIITDRVSNAVTASYGSGIGGANVTDIPGGTYLGITSGLSTFAVENQLLAAGPVTGGIIPVGAMQSDLRIELSSNGPTTMPDFCSLVGAESYPASTTLYAKSVLQDTNYQPYIESATSVVLNDSSQYFATYGQLVRGSTLISGSVSNSNAVTPTTLPGYGHGDTTFFRYEGLPFADPGAASLFVELEACFEVTLGNKSSVGRLAKSPPPKDPVALDVVSDIQKKLPAASTTGNWLSDAASWYGGTMKKAIGYSWEVGAQVASAAGFRNVGDLATQVAKLMIGQGRVPAIRGY